MRFWDSSALVPLLVEEDASARVRAEYARDPDLLAWWGSPIECVSAVVRLEREGVLAAEGVVEALARLDALVRSWQEVQPVAAVRQTAVRLLRVHPLRSADALQLAAALVAAAGDPWTLGFVTFDARLAGAAQREGLAVLLPT